MNKCYYVSWRKPGQGSYCHAFHSLVNAARFMNLMAKHWPEVYLRTSDAT